MILDFFFISDKRYLSNIKSKPKIKKNIKHSDQLFLFFLLNKQNYFFMFRKQDTYLYIKNKILFLRLIK